MDRRIDNTEDLLRREIERFVQDSPANRLTRLDGSPFFEKPLVGFADADDPLFADFKKIIGGFHLHPRDVLFREYPDLGDAWQGGSVICWVLPVQRATRKSNRREMRHPSRAWAHTRTYGEEFNTMLRTHVVSFITRLGFRAAAPTLCSCFTVLQSETSGFTSNWSERHAAYAAGLGTFGLSRGLITPRGIAMRCGSVVTSLKLRPTPREYTDRHQYCLFFNSGTCAECIRRCPAGAISEQGHDKERCMMHCHEIMQKSDDYDAAMPGCGLCQTGVPCESGIPRRTG